MTAPEDGGSDAFTIHTVQPNRERSPGLQHVASAELCRRPRSRKEIVRYEIIDENSGELKEPNVVLKTFHYQQHSWEKDARKTFTLEGYDQIRRAVQFMLAVCEGDISGTGGDFVVIPLANTTDSNRLQQAVRSLTRDGRTKLFSELLSYASDTPDILDSLMEQARRNPHLFTEAAALLNLTRYQNALKQLKQLISASDREHDFQSILTQHPWMFGSEYSRLEESRRLTRDSQQDFILRRTVDDYIEIIEIKTPLNGAALFRSDSSHNSHYASYELSRVVGQVQKYIEEIDARRFDIAFSDRLDPNKIRAKIIIGRDGDEAQRLALRRFNGHLHRIEVLTFDHLERTAAQVVSYLQRLMPKHPGR